MADFLSGASLDWARTHIDRFGDTDLFPVPFEYTAIATVWRQARATLAATDLGQYLVDAFRRVLVPKPTGGFSAQAAAAEEADVENVRNGDGTARGGALRLAPRTVFSS